MLAMGNPVSQTFGVLGVFLSDHFDICEKMQAQDDGIKMY